MSRNEDLTGWFSQMYSTGDTYNPTEVNDARRGHTLIAPDEGLAAWPCPAEGDLPPLEERIMHAHFFAGACDWWLASCDPESGRAFGFINLGDPVLAEWGYFDLNEMSQRVIRLSSRLTVVIERDLFWTPKPYAAINSLA